MTRTETQSAAPVHLTASEIMFANAERDWPKGGGWYVQRGDAWLGPFATKRAAATAQKAGA